MSQEQAGSGDSCRRGLAEHQQGWNPASARAEKRVATKFWEKWFILSRYFWSLIKWEEHIETAVVATPGLDVNTLNLKQEVCSQNIVMVY